MATLNDITVTRSAFIDIRTSTGVAVGAALYIVNKSDSVEALVHVAGSAPANSVTDGLDLPPGRTLIIAATQDGVYIRAKRDSISLGVNTTPIMIGENIPGGADLEASFETSNRGNTALGVFVQDQTSFPLSVPFLQERTTTSLAIDATVDSRFVTLTAGHGAVVGNIMELAQTATGVFFQATIIGIVTNVIELDQPVNFPYLATDIAVISTDDMIVDGSTTPQVFSILPLPTQSGDMVRVIWEIQNVGNDMDFSTFGGAAALPTGCVLRIKNGDGTFRNLMGFMTNGDIINQCFDHTFLLPQQGNATRGFTARLTWGGQSKHGMVIRLDGSLGEELQVLIQDDLTAGATANSIFTMRAQGHELQE